VELIVILLLNVSVDMVMLLPGIIDSVSYGEVANIREELALIVAKESVAGLVEILAIEPFEAL
jgi:hypothetical protein